MNKYECDSCGWYGENGDVEIKERVEGHEVVVHYECPHCGEGLGKHRRRENRGVKRSGGAGSRRQPLTDSTYEARRRML